MDRGEEKWEGGINLLSWFMSKLGCALRSAMRDNAESLTMCCDTDKQTRREDIIIEHRAQDVEFRSSIHSLYIKIK